MLLFNPGSLELNKEIMCECKRGIARFVLAIKESSCRFESAIDYEPVEGAAYFNRGMI